MFEELLPWLIAIATAAAALIKAVSDRYAVRTEKLQAEVKADYALKEIDVERERGDLRTRDLVDGLLKMYINRNDELVARLEKERGESAMREAEYTHQIDGLRDAFDVALTHARGELDLRVKALEKALRDKDALIEAQRVEIARLQAEIEGYKRE